MSESDLDRYCIACGYAECHCGKNHHPTVNEVHAMYQQLAALRAAARKYVTTMSDNGFTGGKMPLACGNAEYRLLEALAEVSDEQRGN